MKKYLLALSLLLNACASPNSAVVPPFAQSLLGCWDSAENKENFRLEVIPFEYFVPSAPDAPSYIKERKDLWVFYTFDHNNAPRTIREIAKFSESSMTISAFDPGDWTDSITKNADGTITLKTEAIVRKTGKYFPEYFVVGRTRTFKKVDCPEL